MLEEGIFANYLRLFKLGNTFTKTMNKMFKTYNRSNCSQAFTAVHKYKKAVQKDFCESLGNTLAGSPF